MFDFDDDQDFEGYLAQRGPADVGNDLPAWHERELLAADTHKTPTAPRMTTAESAIDALTQRITKSVTADVLAGLRKDGLIR